MTRNINNSWFKRFLIIDDTFYLDSSTGFTDITFFDHIPDDLKEFEMCAVGSQFYIFYLGKLLKFEYLNEENFRKVSGELREEQLEKLLNK